MDGLVHNVVISISDPREVQGSWVCQYQVGWPDQIAEDDIWGADAIQALYLTMQALALTVYASSYHKSGRLYWDKPGTGYGFPMPKAGRNDLVGRDRDSY